MRHRVQATFETASIADALRLLPTRLVERLPVAWHCGVDPVFAGLHALDGEYQSMQGPYSYRTTAHLYSHGDWYGDAPSVVVLPSAFERIYARCGPVEVVVHELGHALDRLLCQRGVYLDVPPVNHLALASRWEAFAEAFEYWFAWPGQEQTREVLGREGCEMMERAVSGADLRV